ncbi:SURF1 family protein [Brachybacterium saurashtrense]|uniref:SURF1-like protein n=1 Tax=Brachybacterium saurashtrense TaxID=556288 RepID=A0A345YMG7_9MICO|nr:SURF1 family protein [Brachybacterium saurashtrense]AXK45119.1 SURF1 family protein [Brachybacterium saurashtrense]RRR22128.1 SURF1 family protein [Brachybacterium saurashtrense]
MRERSARLQVLFSRDTLLGLVAVLVLAAVCVALGMWQYGRYEAKRDAAAVIRTNYDASPVPLQDVLPQADAPLTAADDWTPVEMTGAYCTDPACTLYVRNRPLSGAVGFWQLVPFRTEDGEVLLVVRGWVPTQGSDSAPADPPAIPEGEITVTARLRPAEVVLDREPPAGQTHSVNPEQSAALMGVESGELITQAYGELVAEQPEAERPTALPAPDTSLGPHLSYAFQWWIFALFFPAALIHRTRRALQDLAAEEHDGADAEEQTATGTPAGDGTPRSRTPRGTAHRPRRTVHTRRRGQDEEEEDALIDQQER